MGNCCMVEEDESETEFVEPETPSKKVAHRQTKHGGGLFHGVRGDIVPGTTSMDTLEMRTKELSMQQSDSRIISKFSPGPERPMPDSLAAPRPVVHAPPVAASRTSWKEDAPEKEMGGFEAKDPVLDAQTRARLAEQLQQLRMNLSKCKDECDLLRIDCEASDLLREVARDPSPPERMRKFKSLLCRWHPDKNPTMVWEATVMYQRLQQRKGLIS
ncbi:unnamed protein product [Cladocopium goreaui]|uniref:J domain-containing protein n=1 Tax=Cladocopium goreaui TaxID=2562237 RepID=A0A9P1BMI9_9DINO|nr:unnamed protein product [Cladocopium goreaui]|mmetsp:Transcript_5413/g.12421  ORF Transcript_5413/g.12421 Transcript_5413/m.12421 type:complete len:215 (+) Transcript_5413:79-723(+)